MLEKYKVLRNAERYVLNGKYDRAIREYRRLVEQERDDPTLLNTLGDLLLKRGDREEALSTFHKVSDIYTESGFLTKAAAMCKKMRQVNPGDAEACEKLADLYLRQGMNRLAVPLLQEAIREHEEWGRIEDALQDLDRLLEIGETGETQRQMAVLYLRDEKPEEAARHFDRAAQLFGESGQLEAAGECQKEARRLGVNTPDFVPGPVEAPGDSDSQATPDEGNTEIAEPREPVTDEPADMGVLTNSGEPATEEGAEPEGPEESPGAAAAFELLGNDLSATAAEVAGEAFQLDEDDFELLDDGPPGWDLGEEADPAAPALSAEEWEGPVEDALEEADFYLKLGLRDEARALLARLLVSFPEDPRVLRRAEKIHLPLPETAEPAVEPEAQPEGESFETEVDLALDVLFEGGDGGGVHEVLRYDVVRDDRAHDENDPKVHYDLGLAYKEMGLIEDSVDKFRHAYERFEDAENAPQKVLCCSMLANAYLQLEDFAEAAEWARRGLDLPGVKEFEWKALQYDASRALERLGQRDAALTGYRSISEKDPEYRDIGARVERLSLQVGHD